MKYILGGLQLSIDYIEAQAEALGLGCNEATTELSKQFLVVPGECDRLALLDKVLADRTVLNAGSSAQRTIVPATMLRLTDE